jgi:hypothetical protein
MNSNEKLQADSGLPSLPLAEGFDEDLSSFISNLIDQNAALIRKLQEFDSLEEVVDGTPLTYYVPKGEGAKIKATFGETPRRSK